MEAHIVETHIYSSYIPLWITLLPLAGAILVLVAHNYYKEKIRDLFLVLFTTVTILLTISLYPQVITLGKQVETPLPFLLQGIKFSVDAMGLLFAIFTALLWWVASLYALVYMKHEHKRTRFYFFWLLTLSANLGVVLAGDLFSLFVFFEALGLLAYPLVIHTEKEDALKAGLKYLWMTIFGGLNLLFGILLLYRYTGTFALLPALEELQEAGSLRYIISGLMILGFGVKAGMVPVHVWLPDAHPAAPSPASALLSGVMIKAGAYGIIRVVSNIFRPPFAGEHVGGGAENLWRVTSSLGYTILWIGIVTMFLGVVMALLQENSKRMLAYHSISQMGYILMGIGCAGYLGHEGALGFVGAIYHVANHALFKACLFLGAGAVFYRTAELNMYKLGGLWRRMPLTAILTLIAALGISGIPLFNGFVSKTILHHAISESVHFGGIRLKIAEIIFIITGGGTLASFMKLTIFTFLGRMPEKYKAVKSAPPLMIVSMTLLASIIVLFGIFPHLLINGFLIPALKTWGFSEEALHHLSELRIMTAENLMGLLPSMVAGVLIFSVGVRYGLFHVHFPKWFGVDYWYVKLAEGLVSGVISVATLSNNTSRSLSGLMARLYEKYALGSAHWIRRYKQFTTAFFVGASRARDQEIRDFIERKLEEERAMIVRGAIKEERARLARSSLSVREKQKRYNVVRNAASKVANELRKLRWKNIEEVMYKIPAEMITAAFPEEQKVNEVKADIVKIAIEVAEDGQEITPMVLNQFSARIAEALSAERFDAILYESLFIDKVKKTAIKLERSTVERMEEAYRPTINIVAKGYTWLVAIMRIIAEVISEEKIPWRIETRYSYEEVVRTRNAIRRYTRDMSMNVLIIVIMITAIMASIIYSQ